MTSNLKYSLSANSTRIGVNHSTNETFEFDTGSACIGNDSCVMNGNTVMTEQTTSGGYYYSWYAATAGTGILSTVGEAAGSICPQGWRLPANYSVAPSKSYGSLTEAYLGFHVQTTGNYTATMESVPLSFKRANFYNEGTYRDGSDGYCWSSTAMNSSGGSDLFYFTGHTDPQAHDGKYLGFPVRCVNN